MWVTGVLTAFAVGVGVGTAIAIVRAAIGS